MLKTNLRYFNYRTLKLYKVYQDKHGYHYIRCGNEYKWVDKYDIFDPADGPMLNRTNLVRYLRKQIKFYSERTDSFKRDNDDWNMNRAIGSRDAFEDALEYVMKLRRDEK